MRLAAACRYLGLSILAIAIDSAAADAQRSPAQSATASMMVVAFVAPVLEFTTVAVTETVHGPLHSLVTSTVAVRGNVPHRVVVRLAAPESQGARTEVLDALGRWIAIGSGQSFEVASSAAPGESTHRVQCRTSREAPRGIGGGVGCQLAYDLISPGARSPTASTTIPARVAGGLPGTATMVSVSPTT